MSDFDKEAEREKLREKFARDEQKRERTSRMSELLLKGATMTNKHHDCGSPIFRWQGEEFCPTCQGAPAGEQAGSPDATEDAGTTAEAQSQPQSGAEGAGADAGTGADADSEGSTGVAHSTVDVETPENGATPESPPPETGTGSERPDAPTGTGRETGDPAATGSAPTPTPPADRSPAPTPTPEPAAGETGGVADARASLERTLTTVARQAEATDDLSRKRDYLAAAREAAEALEAVRRAER